MPIPPLQPLRHSIISSVNEMYHHDLPSGSGGSGEEQERDIGESDTFAHPVVTGHSNFAVIITARGQGRKMYLD